MKVPRENFEKELMKLNINISTMGTIVSDSMEELVEIIKNNDSQAAINVIEADPEVRDLARKVENRCIRLIMRQQPVAQDLRFISSSLKLVTDLERMQKQALEIAEISLEIGNKRGEPRETLCKMVEASLDISVAAINAYLHKDLNLVKEAVSLDDTIDSYYDDMRREIVKDIKEDHISAEKAVNLLLQSKYLEKIGDHAENIANWVNYSVEGEQLKENPQG